MSAGAALLLALAPTAPPGACPPVPALAAHAAQVALAVQSGEWQPTWEQLATLRALEPADPAYAQLHAALSAKAKTERDDLRARLLAVHLLRLGPRAESDAELEPPPADARPFEGVEHWLAAEVLVPGPARARAIERGLEWEGTGRDQIVLAYDIGREDAGNLRLADALVVQQALHRNQQAPWSAGGLALTLRQLGRYDEADQVLAEELRKGQDEAYLWSCRGLNACGLGELETARSYFGRALAGGSEDAAMVLALLDYQQGDRVAARLQFRGLVSGPSPHAWSLRGWGLSQLPRRP